MAITITPIRDESVVRSERRVTIVSEDVRRILADHFGMNPEKTELVLMHKFAGEVIPRKVPFTSAHLTMELEVPAEMPKP